MSRNLRHWVILLFIVLAWGTGWLMLWTLSFYLTNNGQQAVLFLPQEFISPLLFCSLAATGLRWCSPFADDVLAP